MTTDVTNPYPMMLISLSESTKDKKPRNPVLASIIERVFNRDKTILNDGSVLAPVVTVDDASVDDFAIAISNMPKADLKVINTSALERIINHIKDAYVKGSFDDRELLELCGNRQFRFCATYYFGYDDELSQLKANFIISHTELGPAWVHYKYVPSKGKNHPGKVVEDSVELMSYAEIHTVASAFIRQLTQALQNYVNMVYNDAQANGKTPDYYSIPGAPDAA